MADNGLVPRAGLRLPPSQGSNAAKAPKASLPSPHIRPPSWAGLCLAFHLYPTGSGSSKRSLHARRSKGGFRPPQRWRIAQLVPKWTMARVEPPAQDPVTLPTLPRWKVSARVRQSCLSCLAASERGVSHNGRRWARRGIGIRGRFAAVFAAWKGRRQRDVVVVGESLLVRGAAQPPWMTCGDGVNVVGRVVVGQGLGISRYRSARARGNMRGAMKYNLGGRWWVRYLRVLRVDPAPSGTPVADSSGGHPARGQGANKLSWVLWELGRDWVGASRSLNRSNSRGSHKTRRG